MNYSDRISILNSEIPSGGFGRKLTSSELKKLRENGHSCSTGWIVTRAYDSPNHGIVYRPGKTGGYDHANIYVETR